MLGYRKTPAGPRMLRPWMTCPAGSWPPITGGRDHLVAAPVDGLRTVAGPRRSGPEAPSIRIGVSAALVSPARNRP